MKWIGLQYKLSYAITWRKFDTVVNVNISVRSQISVR